MHPKVPLAAVALTLAIAGPAVAQVSADEAAIRDAVAQLGKGGVDLRTRDQVFFSGSYVRPIVTGENEPELTTRGRRSVPGSDRVTWRVRRIEVASSGDLAYEFSDGTIARRVKRPDGTEEAATLENSALRVWKKVDGRWLVAVHFSAPHGDRP
jgi:ketosteroid isomerase-like protein